MPDPHKVIVPTSIETPRLLLRSFSPEDATELHSALVESINELRQYLWFLPWVAEEQTIQSAKVRCQTAQSNFRLRTDLPYLAFEKATGRLVASTGLHRTDWILPKTEVGYWVRSSETGNGYASEGVNAITAWALNVLCAKQVELITDQQNKSSRAVAIRCGFKLEGLMQNEEQAPDGRLRTNCIYVQGPT